MSQAKGEHGSQKQGSDHQSKKEDQGGLKPFFDQYRPMKMHKVTHKGRDQFVDNIIWQGKKLRLVCGLDFQGKRPREGETWLVFPNESRNGHIVFCVAKCRISDSSGNWYIEWRLKQYIGKHINIPGALYGALTIVKSVEVVSGELTMSYMQRLDRMETEGYFTWPVRQMYSDEYGGKTSIYYFGDDRDTQVITL